MVHGTPMATDNESKTLPARRSPRPRADSFKRSDADGGTDGRTDGWTDVVADMQQTLYCLSGAQFNGRADGFTRIDSVRPVVDR